MRRRFLAACVLAAAAAATPAQAAASGEVTTAPVVESWYQLGAACSAPAGCPPPLPLPSPYPADTLHVGVTAGQEDSRTVLRLALDLPAGTKPAGGQLRLPLAALQDGTRVPEDAALRACLVTDAVDPAEGAFGPGPTVDCERAEVLAEFVPAVGTTPAALTVDLTDLAAGWTGGATPGAVALLPADGTAPTTNWHLAFSGRERQGAGVTRITAAVSYVGSAVDVAEDPPPPVEAPVEQVRPESVAPPPVDLVALPPAVTLPDVDAVEPAPVEEPDLLAPALPQDAAPEVQALPVADLRDTRFRYPVVFLLPLLVAVTVGWLGNAFTRDLVGGQA